MFSLKWQKNPLEEFLVAQTPWNRIPWFCDETELQTFSSVIGKFAKKFPVCLVVWRVPSKLRVMFSLSLKLAFVEWEERGQEYLEH